MIPILDIYWLFFEPLWSSDCSKERSSCFCTHLSFFPFFSLTYTMIWRWGRILVKRKKIKSTATFSLTLIYIHAPFYVALDLNFSSSTFFKILKNEHMWKHIIEIILWCSHNQDSYVLIQWNDFAWFHKQWLVPQKSC